MTVAAETAVFLLGLGAQKAGTTWLHRYLAAQPGFVRGSMKEYHVWDALYGTDQNLPLMEGENVAEREALRERLIANPELYFEHFTGLLSQGSITADITPAYSALPVEAVRRIRDGFDSRGVECRAIFLMRDPVERCWSAARMYRRKGLVVAGLDPALDEADYVLAYSASEHALRRGGYERTVQVAELAFSPERLLFGFYETLFDREAVDRLSHYLGIESRHEFRANEYNVSPKRNPLPDDVRRAVAETYRSTLEFCAAKFPETRALWPSYSLVGL